MNPDPSGSPTDSPTILLTALASRLNQIIAGVFNSGSETRLLIEGLVRELPGLEARLGRLTTNVQHGFRAAGFPPCRLMSIEDWNIVADAFHNGSPDLGPLVEQMCREMLASAYVRERMLNDWTSNPVITRRLHIVSAALDAHMRGHYTLSVPVFLAQLEGLVADGTGHIGRMYGDDYKAHLNTIVAPESVLGPWVRDFIEATILATFVHGSAPSSDLSRHAILHGADTCYDSERNSMRVIMLFDYVQDLVRDLVRPVDPVDG